jgi:hypothetical protein
MKRVGIIALLFAAVMALSSCTLLNEGLPKAELSADYETLTIQGTEYRRQSLLAIDTSAKGEAIAVIDSARRVHRIPGEDTKAYVALWDEYIPLASMSVYAAESVQVPRPESSEISSLVFVLPWAPGEEQKFIRIDDKASLDEFRVLTNSSPIMVEIEPTASIKELTGRIYFTGHEEIYHRGFSWYYIEGQGSFLGKLVYSTMMDGSYEKGSRLDGLEGINVTDLIVPYIDLEAEGLDATDSARPYID